MRMEVRCCCQPHKLLGWFEFIHEPQGEEINFVRTQRWGYRQTFGDVVVGKVTLPIEVIQIEDGRKYRAIKAEGMTVDELREIQGFIPAL